MPETVLPVIRVLLVIRQLWQIVILVIRVITVIQFFSIFQGICTNSMVKGGVIFVIHGFYKNGLYINNNAQFQVCYDGCFVCLHCEMSEFISARTSRFATSLMPSG